MSLRVFGKLNTLRPCKYAWWLRNIKYFYSIDVIYLDLWRLLASNDLNEILQLVRILGQPMRGSKQTNRKIKQIDDFIFSKNCAITLKQTNKLNGIVKTTKTQDKTINAFPHDADSAFCSSSAVIRDNEGKKKKQNII